MPRVLHCASTAVHRKHETNTFAFTLTFIYKTRFLRISSRERAPQRDATEISESHFKEYDAIMTMNVKIRIAALIGISLYQTRYVHTQISPLCNISYICGNTTNASSLNLRAAWKCMIVKPTMALAVTAASRRFSTHAHTQRNLYITYRYRIASVCRCVCLCALIRFRRFAGYVESEITVRDNDASRWQNS